MSGKYEWIVQAPATLLSFMQDSLADKTLSLRKIKGWIDAGYCFVEGRQERFSRFLVTRGQKVTLRVREPRATKAIEVLFEDEVLLIINKPAGITCDARLEAQLKGALLVHRLDKETSGLLLLAKSAKIKEYFVKEFKNHAVRKQYVAICDGAVREESGTIKNYLGPIERYQGHVKWGVVSRDGHFAHTEWKVVKRAKKATLLQLMPVTGKTHQLRIHTSGMHHPILGDNTYAKSFRCSYSAPRILLHSIHLSFTHPAGNKMEISCSLPDDFEACLKELF